MMQHNSISTWKLTWKELLTKAVTNLPERTTLFFSGGFDSSIILYSMLEQGIKPQQCITFRFNNLESPDLYYSKKAADIFNLNLKVIDIPKKTKRLLIEDCRTSIAKLGNARPIDVQCATVFDYMLSKVETKNVILGFFDNTLYKSGRHESIRYSNFKHGVLSQHEYQSEYKEIRRSILFKKKHNHHVLKKYIENGGFNFSSPFLNHDLFSYSQNFHYGDFNNREDGKFFEKYFLYQLWQPYFDKVGNFRNKNNMHIVSGIKKYHYDILLQGTDFKDPRAIYNRIEKGEL